MIKIIDKTNFRKKVLNGSGLQIARFCAEWSGPCQMMGPIYQEMFDRYNSMASFYKIDVDEAPLLKNQLGVTELPTLFFYKNGRVIEIVTGMITREFLVEKIEKALNQ